MNKRHNWLVLLSIALALATLLALTACTPEELEIWAETHLPSITSTLTLKTSNSAIFIDGFP